MTPAALLFVPGDNARRIEKALQSDAGTVILDLEDGVAPAAKADARQLVAQTLAHRTPDSHKRLLVRCNAADTPEFSLDLDTLRKNPPDGVLLSKCESADAVLALTSAMPHGEIIPLLESALGIYHLEALVKASPRIRQVAFGSVDFALDLNVPWSPEGDERRYAMGRIVLISRALDLLAPIDAVFPMIDDQRAFQADAQLGRRLGFGAKMVIHPKQVEWLKPIYRASDADIEWSRRIVAAFESHTATGALKLEGHLIDLPVYRQARSILASAPEITG